MRRVRPLHVISRVKGSDPHSVTQKQVNPWLIAFAVMFATFMEVLDTTVVNVSLPHREQCRRRPTKRRGR